MKKLSANMVLALVYYARNEISAYNRMPIDLRLDWFTPRLGTTVALINRELLTPLVRVDSKMVPGTYYRTHHMTSAGWRALPVDDAHDLAWTMNADRDKALAILATEAASRTHHSVARDIGNAINVPATAALAAATVGLTGSELMRGERWNESGELVTHRGTPARPIVNYPGSLDDLHADALDEDFEREYAAETRNGDHAQAIKMDRRGETATPVKPCGCEHADHVDDEGQGHAYLGVEAGTRVADYVGEICDECAAGHLAAWVVESPWPTEVMKHTPEQVRAMLANAYTADELREKDAQAHTEALRPTFDPADPYRYVKQDMRTVQGSRRSGGTG